MRFNEAFIYTLREDPSEAELVSHKLMTRAGMIMKVSAGIYNYLPLGYRVIKKIENIIREELAKEHCAELLMPTVVPAELWRESGRWGYYGKELLRFKDRKENDFCLGPTHEEVITDIARRSMKSYRDYPRNLYQIQGKFRDETRPRFGLMRGREFIMKDGYSFHTNEECLDKTYWNMHAAYTRIFTKLGLKFRSVEADSGAIGGSVTHEFHVLADSGEDKIIFCTKCDYAANSEKASKQINDNFAQANNEIALPQDVETPNKKSIEEVSQFLKIPQEKTIKTLLYVIDEDKLVAVLIRGDLECNEVKLRNFFKGNIIEAADENRLLADGFAVGFLGPVGFKSDVKIAADYSVKSVIDGVIGANKKDFHTIHILPKRDLPDLEYDDFSFADKGDLCPVCGGLLDVCRGIEVGQVFKLGTKYSKAMNMTYIDESGENKTPTMGCYGIGVGRTAAAAIEQNHDENGIIFPIEIAPFSVSILLLDAEDKQAVEIAEKLYLDIENAETGIDALFDDRQERPGVKFKDHDLIGIPIQVIVGTRGIKSGTVEVKIRENATKESVAIDKIFEYVVKKIEELKRKIT
ncbi:MAG: proline--tRNA ligase [Chitinispirillales bacterium]|jgi:prolyl-tRNA synthetase|nr:proline--tRNA ligase [Chitinispirillales bacterium]